MTHYRIIGAGMTTLLLGGLAAAAIIGITTLGNIPVKEAHSVSAPTEEIDKAGSGPLCWALDPHYEDGGHGGAAFAEAYAAAVEPALRDGKTPRELLAHYLVNGTDRQGESWYRDGRAYLEAECAGIAREAAEAEKSRAPGAQNTLASY